MRKLVMAMAAIGLMILALPASAVVAPSTLDDKDPAIGDGPRSAECPGTVVWDTGMFDTYTPTATATAFSVGCFVNAENPDGAPPDWRRGGDDFVGTGCVTAVKVWGRYNASGYNSGRRVVGFCVRFHEATDPIYCPDGSITGVDAIGPTVYDEYIGVGSFTEEEVFGGLARNFAYCINLPVPFFNTPGNLYWLDISSDYDLVSDGVAYTQWFWRVNDDGFQYDPACEASNWFEPDGLWPWNCISCPSGQNVATWAGYDCSFKLYCSAAQPTGACCFQDGSCATTTRDECLAGGGNYLGDGTTCDPNPCPQPVGACCFADGSCQTLPESECLSGGGTFYGGVTCDGFQCPAVPTIEKTWGGVKGIYR